MLNMPLRIPDSTHKRCQSGRGSKRKGDKVHVKHLKGMYITKRFSDLQTMLCICPRRAGGNGMAQAFGPMT
jgi:hypothetical protein